MDGSVKKTWMSAVAGIGLYRGILHPARRASGATQIFLLGIKEIQG